VLSFKAKGGKAVRKECDAAKLVRAIGILRGLPGKRMFQLSRQFQAPSARSPHASQRVPA